MNELLRGGAANNLSATVGFALGSEKYADVACCPPLPVSFHVLTEATNGNRVVLTHGIILRQNEGGICILTAEGRTDSSSQEDQKRKDIKMKALKEKFKEKLEGAKKLREKLGDPIALGRSIIEIPEDKADQKLDEVKGFKYVSKKV